ncbi:efflux transporter, RND family, MFP subunit [Plesiocystis pacifica SIR-1]|uniref:Efflux transporter, RND family, MFP subunit n=1 Tax=Plesiocystis pacifica SIR-1 TaxID=391625 RepID=A6GCY3_9BACT|nr:efflux RND transporter periplasmic adaptor subunit [Plesiocystis pacifica]EDM76307.1 efflux transporter, RND family, MFP subunit [Plesiocystis pacifica SIR-1]
MTGCPSSQGAQQAKAGAGERPAPVEVAVAELGSIEEQWTLLGSVRSLRAASLAFGAGGELTFLEVREGDRVELGAVLAEIDEDRARAQLSAAISSRRESERELAQARREAERAAELGEAVLASEVIEREAVRAETLEARKGTLAARIRAAKAELSDYQMLAPFSGVVAARHVDVGQWIDPGQLVLELVDPEAVEVLVDALPRLAGHVRVGGRASLRPAEGLPGAEPVEAEIVGVVPSLDPTTRNFTVRLRPLAGAGEEQAWLVPGASVGVAFPVRFSTQEAGAEVEAEAPSVIVPRDALVLGAVDIRVVTVVDGAAKPVQIEVLASAGDQALVRGAGLEPRSVVVTRGNERLRPGQSVRVLEPSTAEGDSAEAQP